MWFLHHEQNALVAVTPCDVGLLCHAAYCLMLQVLSTPCGLFHNVLPVPELETMVVLVLCNTWAALRCRQLLSLAK